jgi:WhiB family transcriptional regulator, redox-sensing transcriptional regulator
MERQAIQAEYQMNPSLILPEHAAQIQSTLMQSLDAAGKFAVPAPWQPVLRTIQQGQFAPEKVGSFLKRHLDERYEPYKDHPGIAAALVTAGSWTYLVRKRHSGNDARNLAIMLWMLQGVPPAHVGAMVGEAGMHRAVSTETAMMVRRAIQGRRFEIRELFNPNNYIPDQEPLAPTYLEQSMGKWMMHGACGTVDPRLFFPVEENDRSQWPRIAQAKQVCGRCVVMTDCRAWALQQPHLPGVWGGLTQAERQLGRQVSA